MDWTTQELELIIRDYFEMFSNEIAGKHYSKTSHRKALLPLLVNRTEGSIEFKHQNISAILQQQGLPYLKGYKPKSHFQQQMIEVVTKFIEGKKQILERQFENFVNADIPITDIFQDFENLITPPPVKTLFEEQEPVFKPIKVNYLEKEQNNRSLGEKGELLVIEYEKWHLNKIDKPQLADKIEWISKEQGDGAGFDILSKNNDGTDKYIEVKTTKLLKETPIFISKKEVQFARKYKMNFHLYRLFSFGSNTKMFTRLGPYESFCHLEPTSFKGIF